MKKILFLFILVIVFMGCQNRTISPKQESPAKTSHKVYFSFIVEGITCSGDEKIIQETLIALDGIDSAFASHIEKRVLIYADTIVAPIAEIQKAIDNKGYITHELIK